MRKANKIRYIILAFLLGIISVMFGGGGIASADINRSYSNVADDLRKDGNFNAWEYPAKATDYSLQVIQIAESAAGELFVYVYQPSGAVADLRATCINMTLSEEVNGTDLYNLKYLNSSGVFYKYIAEGVKVSSAAERLYNITSIYREWNEDYDKGTGNDNTIDEVVFEVGKLFKVTTKDGKLVYENTQTEVITVTDKYVGLLRYTDSILFGVESNCDSHFIAFSTDKKIEDLKKTKISFIQQRYRYSYLSNETTKIGEEKKTTVEITEDEIVSTEIFSFFPKVHLWERIQTCTKFVGSESISDLIKPYLIGKQWVLRFYETEYSRNYGAGGGTDTYTRITGTTILELTFETAGKVYNLGVVDNKQSGSGKPVNVPNLEWWQILLIVIFCVLILSLVLKLLSLVAPVFGVILQGLIFLITSPFRLVIWIVNKIKGD